MCDRIHEENVLIYIRCCRWRYRYVGFISTLYGNAVSIRTCVAPNTWQSWIRWNVAFCSLPRTAGVLLLGTVGEIQKYSLESMETACQIKENKLVRPFAFRVHTHELGIFSYWRWWIRSVSGGRRIGRLEQTLHYSNFVFVHFQVFEWQVIEYGR